MNIETMAATLHVCRDDDREFTVSHLGDRIALFGTVGNQLFSYSGEFTPSALKEAFPNRRAAVRMAMLHTRGILNKKKVEGNAVELHKSGVLTFLRMQELTDLIQKCNCAPSRFVEKLLNKGYADVIVRLDLYEESPEMVSTTEALIDFISCL